jgi:hypothetical protein
MKLANPNEYIKDLTDFASAKYSGGEWVWVDGKVGLTCTVLESPIGSRNFTVKPSMCYAYAVHYVFCEYNSEFE